MKVVAAFNESDDSRAAVAWAADVAKATGGEVHVVYAVPAPAIPAFSSPRLIDELVSAATEAAAKPLDAVVREVRARGVPAHAHLRRWLVVDSILEKAAEIGAELITIGRRGSARITQLLIGTSSSEVVRLAPVSVLVVHKDESAHAAPDVVVAVDGSAHSVKAISVARSVFPDAKLVLCHVAQPGEQGGEEIVRRAAADAGVDAGTVTTAIRRGDPASEILAELSKGTSRAVVLGPRGLGQLAGILLGSVSEKVLQLARKPVLVAR